MSRFSSRNVLAWIAGTAGLLAVVTFKLGLFDGLFGAVVLCAAAVAGAYWLYQTWERSLHARHLKEFAATNGWTYAEAGPWSVVPAAGFPFGEGTGRQVEDFIEGAYGGAHCSSYTYRFEYRLAGERSAEQIFTVTQTAIDVPLPRLDLIPEDVGSRILGALGAADIDLESAEFNRTWRVQGTDRRFAVDVVDPRMMELLLRHRVPGLAIRIDGTRVLAWSAGRATVGELSRRLDAVTGVARRIPAHVVRAYDEAERQRRADEAVREANAPGWATTGGVLNSGTYTGIGVDSDADGVQDWDEHNR